jgi:ectoine hydroxylase-related dioxygenase (phytanoyl-CoA dioxygenase family)
MHDLLAALDEAGARKLLTELLGERPVLWATKCAMRKVPADATAAWHQDSFLGTSNRTINIWIALSECGRDAPGLDVLPPRLDHFVERPYGPPIDYVVAPETVNALAADTPVLRPDFSPGDALIFDQFLLHQTGYGPDLTRQRYGFECWFFTPSTYPDDKPSLVF